MLWSFPRQLVCGMFVLWGMLSAHGASPDAGGPLDQLVSYFNSDLKAIDEELAHLKPLAAVNPIPIQQTSHLGYSSPLDNTVMTRWVQVDLGQPVNIDRIVLVPLKTEFYGWPGPGYGFPVRYRVEAANNDQMTNSVIIADASANDVPNPGSNPVVYPAQQQMGRYVRVTATKPWARKDRTGVEVGAKVFALGELMVLAGNLNLTAGLPASAVTFGGGSIEEAGYRKAYLVDGQSILGPPVTGDPTSAKGILTQKSDKRDAQAWVQVDLHQEIDVREIRLLPAWDPDSPERRGFGFPNIFKIEISNSPNMEKATLIGIYPEANALINPNPQGNTPFENPVTIRGTGAELPHGRYVRLTATSLASTGKNIYALAMGEMEVYSDSEDSENWALGKPVTASSSSEEKGWSQQYLVDGKTSQGRLVSWPKWFDLLDDRREASARMDELRGLREVKSKESIATVIRAAGYVIGGSLLLFVYLSFRSLLKKRRAVEELRARIARDIHDEIGSGMGTISLLSRMAQDGDWEDGKEDLREINRLAMSMAEAVRDIVWFNRTDVDTVRDLLMKMRETAETMLGKKMELNFQTIGAELVRPMNMEIRREIFMIYKEALHNIQKHAGAHSVEIRAGLEHGEFVLYLRDDGKGFDPSQGKSGAGLGSMKQRAASLHGALEVETAPGTGTSLSLRARLR